MLLRLAVKLLCAEDDDLDLESVKIVLTAGPEGYETVGLTSYKARAAEYHRIGLLCHIS